MDTTGFEVFMAVMIQVKFFWVVLPCHNLKEIDLDTTNLCAPYLFCLKSP
jgi:hypothetical protein